MLPDARAWRLSAALLITATALGAAPADKPCSKADAASAEKAADRVLMWPAMQKLVKDWGHCDSGQARELFTEALLRLLVGNWLKIGDLEALYNNDAVFREWINTRLADPSLPRDDADQVHDLSQNSCPKARKKLCDELHAAVEKGKEAGAAKKPAPAPAAPATPVAPASPSAPPKPPEAREARRAREAQVLMPAARPPGPLG